MRAVLLIAGVGLLLAAPALASTADPQAPMAKGQPSGPQAEVSDDATHARVVLRCIVMVDATVDKCAVTREVPAGHGLGEAALRMSREIKLSPDTFKREMVGQEVDIPLSFARDAEPADTPVGEPGPDAAAPPM